MAAPKQKILYLDATGNLASGDMCGAPCQTPTTDVCTRQVDHDGAHGVIPIPVPPYPPGSPQTFPLKPEEIADPSAIFLRLATAIPRK